MTFKSMFLWLAIAAVASAQTTISGSSLAYRSTGTSSGSAWTLDRDGYLGTYITLAAPGNVTISVNADGTASGGVNPHLAVAIADTLTGFNVTSGAHDYTAMYALPAGTFFVRTQFDNDLALTPRQVKVNSLTVTGATVSNSATSANALAASDSYIANYRKGNATISLAGLGLPAGSPIGVSMKRIGFNFGHAVPGSSASEVNSYIGSGGTSKQTNYQAKLLQNFNAVVQENAAKWVNNEWVRGVLDTRAMDQILSFAQAHNLPSRLHTGLWDLDDGNPDWADSLRTSAAGGSTSAKNDLRGAITSRTNYWLAPNANKVIEVDVYNESYQGQCCNGNRSYWSIFGASGIAGIYNEAKQVAGNAKLFVNEFESLIYPDGGNAAGFFPHIEELQQAAITAGYGKIIGGIGTEHYPWSIGMHSPTDIIKAMQTYAVSGLPQAVTEFGIVSGVSQSDAATILKDVMRLEFGNPSGTGMFIWGFQSENGGGNLGFAPAGAFYTLNTSNWNNWTITPAGKAWQDQLGIQDWDNNQNNGWNTQLTRSLAANGTINFDGYYGDYEITAGGKKYPLSLSKGTSSYSIGGMAGDFNGDGNVNAADYVAWRTSGATAGYEVWRANFGGAGLLLGPVAEPRLSMLVATALFVYAFRRGRAR